MTQEDIEKPELPEAEINLTYDFKNQSTLQETDIPNETKIGEITCGARILTLKKDYTGQYISYASKKEGAVSLEGQLTSCYITLFNILHEIADQLGTPITYVFVSEIPSMQEFFKHKLNTIKWDKIEEYSDGRVVRAIYTVMPNTSTL